MNVLRAALLSVGIATAMAVTAVIKATADRLSQRAAAWLFPDAQALSFRLAWLLVRIAGGIAPSKVYSYRGVGRDLGPAYRVRACEWTGAAEAQADLEEASRKQVRAIQPARLVIPLIGESLALRWANATQRSAGMWIALVFCVFVVPILSAWAIWDALARLISGRQACNPWGSHGLSFALVAGPIFAYKVLYYAVTGGRDSGHGDCVGSRSRRR